MPKKDITPLNLAKKYLKSIRINPFVVDRELVPGFFEEFVFCKALKKSNVVLANKVGLRNHETHIYVDNVFSPAFYSDAEFHDYLLHRDTSKTEKNNKVSIFEKNIHTLLKRRNNLNASYIQQKDALGNYKSSSDDLLNTHLHKWITTHNGDAQVHVGKQEKDGNTFKDFRLGLTMEDYLLMFKYRNSNKVLAVGIPHEYANKFNIIGFSQSERTTLKIAQKKKDDEEEKEDFEYTSSAFFEENGEITSKSPRQAPKRKSKGSSNKGYRGNPRIGRGALEVANFTCENNKNHKSFISGKTRKKYMEPHHLIPISYQYAFEWDIDITSNLICLCPQCHKQFHHGTAADKKDLIQKFFDRRKADLKQCGIEINIDELKAFYNLL